ncbi:MAG: enoyl-CoA hydratase/isomerase family protein [Novosphingobium sp.]|nr:enoyl-CoA hydratase/isomerase family protein [Novosphingobium sp.]
MDTLLVENIGAVRVLTLNRPDKANAADIIMQRRILMELEAAGSDKSVRALVLTGAGRAFSAGGDRDILRQIAEGTCTDHDELGHLTIGAIHAMLALEIPAIAAVNGFAVGYSAGLVALCDVVVMGESAFLSDPHVHYGIAGGPATQMVWPRLCSELAARDILMSGRKVMADEALRIGLCSRVCPDGEERATALEMAEPFTALPAEGIAATKRNFNAPLIAEAAKLAVEPA